MSKNKSISVLSILLHFNKSFSVRHTVVFNNLYILGNPRHTSLMPISVNECLIYITDHLLDISTSMSKRHLKFIRSKTELCILPFHAVISA